MKKLLALSVILFMFVSPISTTQASSTFSFAPELNPGDSFTWELTAWRNSTDTIEKPNFLFNATEGDEISLRIADDLSEINYYDLTQYKNYLNLTVNGEYRNITAFSSLMIYLIYPVIVNGSLNLLEYSAANNNPAYLSTGWIEINDQFYKEYNADNSEFNYVKINRETGVIHHAEFRDSDGTALEIVLQTGVETATTQISDETNSENNDAEDILSEVPINTTTSIILPLAILILATHVKRRKQH